MKPSDVPFGPLLVDTDVVSYLALGEGRFQEFAELIRGHELFICFVVEAEIGVLVHLGVLAEDKANSLARAIDDDARLPVDLDEVARQWTARRVAVRTTGTADDRERRQNDTWIAACALAVDPPLPVVTNNLNDFRVLAELSQLQVVHPDA